MNIYISSIADISQLKYGLKLYVEQLLTNILTPNAM